MDIIPHIEAEVPYPSAVLDFRMPSTPDLSETNASRLRSSYIFDPAIQGSAPLTVLGSSDCGCCRADMNIHYKYYRFTPAGEKYLFDQWEREHLYLYCSTHEAKRRAMAEFTIDSDGGFRDKKP